MFIQISSPALLLAKLHGITSSLNFWLFTQISKCEGLVPTQGTFLDPCLLCAQVMNSITIPCSVKYEIQLHPPANAYGPVDPTFKLQYGCHLQIVLLDQRHLF